ncbi:hypothetical protein BCS42_02265 [Crenothrix sp. D3]|nr:hypothetical protein BCS42_02265 [Crenothrix sp. D3]
MKKLSRVLSISALTCALFALNSSPAVACGPSFLLPIFSMGVRPEQFADFANGKVGIIYPTMYRSALLVAYREFNNLQFSESEQRDLVKNWQAEYENTDTNEATKNAAINNWIAVRKKIVTNEAEPTIYTDRTNPESYSSFSNCNAGAFDNAVKTLDARLEKTKADDANMKDWLRGQDQVFANCSEVKDLPSPVAADAPDWLKADRDYQIAAAHFYATRYDEAKAAFEKIASNTASPWRDTAAYLVARVYIRLASAISENEAEHDKMLAYYQQAEKQLNSVLADKSLASVHAPAQQLLNLINFRLHPDTLHTELAKKLADKTENTTLFQDVTDYRRLLDKAIEYPSDADKGLDAKFRQTELTDWIMTVQAQGKEAFTHAVEKWQASKNTAWLVASLLKASPDSPDVAKLIEASKSIEKTSPAFLTATYHAVRLQTALGQTDEARKTLDAILNDASVAMNASATNQLLSERLLLAQDLAEFVKFSQRHAAAFAYDEMENQLVDITASPKAGEEDYNKNERPWAKRVLFDTDATRIMDTSMPLSLLKQIALHPDLPAYLRSRVVLSAWVRAVILDDDASAQALAPEVAQLIPELKSDMASYSKAKDAKARSYEAVWTLLKNPATRPLVDSGTGRRSAFNEIDNYRDNWWCNTLNPDNTVATPVPLFLTKEQQAQATAENASIAKIAASGSNFLAAKTTEWATFSPKEKRLPEALALAVKSTRYGCQNCDTGKVSKAAFDLLKDRFGSSEWKKKTPYWFKDEGCEVKN